jgi:hypothetical protein
MEAPLSLKMLEQGIIGKNEARFRCVFPRATRKDADDLVDKGPEHTDYQAQTLRRSRNDSQGQATEGTAAQ